MKIRKKDYLTIAGLFFLLLVAAPGRSGAAEEKGVAHLSAGISIGGNLAAMKGVTVTVNLASGHSHTGVVKEVKKGLLQLERLSGREFYDALINVEEIVSLEVRGR